MTGIDPSFQPIEVTPAHAHADAARELQLQICDILRQLQNSYPGIPGDAKGIASIAKELAEVVQDVASRHDGSAASLAKRLQSVRIRGLGQANDLWPRLFTIVAPPSNAIECLHVPDATRRELRRFLRTLFSDRFQGRAQQLDWIIAGVLAWRPRGLRDLYSLFRKVDPLFIGIEAFERQYGSNFSFASSDIEIDGTQSRSDWTMLWEYEGETGYGGAYPEDIRSFLESFLHDTCAQDPKARVLDIGTGRHAATLFARVISPDFELVGIDIANLPAPPAQARIRTFQMSAAELGFPNMDFDAVMSVNGIEYADPNLAYPEMFRVMRPGGHGALVLHRPDSHVLRISREYIAFLEETRLLETLALSHMFIDEPTEAVFREIDTQLTKLMQRTVAPEFERYCRAVLNGIPEAIRGMRADPNQAFRVIERFEKDLRWRHERDRFLIAHMTAIPLDRDNLARALQRHGFAVDAIDELFMDTAGGRALAGWGVRLHRPKDTGKTRGSGLRD